MTVSTTDILAGPYAGNGTADTFAYDWTIQSASEVIVYETDDAGNVSTLTEGTDYTVSGIGNEGGGNITRTAGPLPSGYTWLIKSNFTPTQTTDFTSQGAFYPDVHEAAFDKLTYLIQQLDEKAGRSLLLSPASTGIDTTLPDPQAGYLIGWDSPATKLANIAPGDTVIYVGSTAPDPDVFPLWYDKPNLQLKFWDGALWQSTSGTDISGKVDKLAGASNGYIPTLDTTGNIAGEIDPATLAHLAGAETFTGHKTFTERSDTTYVLAGSGTVSVDPANGHIQYATITGSTTITESLTDGQAVRLVLTNAGTNIIWPAGIVWLGGSAPSLQASGTDEVILTKVGSTLYGAKAGSDADTLDGHDSTYFYSADNPPPTSVDSYDSIGSYAFAIYTSTSSADPNTTVSGSNLKPVSISISNAGSTDGGPVLGKSYTASTLTGTWKCMGYSARINPSAGVYYYGATLWVRIA